MSVCEGCPITEGWKFLGRCIFAKNNDPADTCASKPILKLLVEAVEVSEPKVTYRFGGFSKYDEMVAFWIRRKP